MSCPQGVHQIIARCAFMAANQLPEASTWHGIAHTAWELMLQSSGGIFRQEFYFRSVLQAVSQSKCHHWCVPWSLLSSCTLLAVG